MRNKEEINNLKI